MSLGQGLSVLIKKKNDTNGTPIGSGVIYFIPSQDYFYIFTAKHCICNKTQKDCKKICDNCDTPDITKSKLRIQFNSVGIEDYKVNDFIFMINDFAVLVIKNINNYNFQPVPIRNYSDEKDLIAHGFPSFSNNHWKKIVLKEAEYNEYTEKIDCLIDINSSFNINNTQTHNLSGLSGAGVYFENNNIQKLIGTYIETSNDNQGYVLPFNEKINSELVKKNYQTIIPEEYSDEVKRQINEQFINCFDKLNEIELPNENHLKIYCLKLQNNEYNYENLIKSLKENIRHFTLSRAQIRTYRNEDRLTELLELATNNFNQLDEKKKIGDLLVHNFLESDLNAPKLFSVSELNIGFSSIHFYNTGSSYRLVFGLSEFSEQLDNGIKKCLDYIIENQDKIAINGNLTPTSLYQCSFNNEEFDFLMKMILSNFEDIEKTIGLMIGFSFKIPDELKQKRPNEMKIILHEYINQTIESTKSFITSQLQINDITKYYFVLYLIPFDNFDLLTSSFTKNN